MFMIKKTVYIFLGLAFIGLLFINVNETSAQEGFNWGVEQIETYIATDDSGLSRENATGILKTVINWLLSLVAILALAALIIGGILYIVSIGDEKMAAKAKKAIMYAIIGLIVVGMSFAIITTIETFLTG